jgi:hypothetical protein
MSTTIPSASTPLFHGLSSGPGLLDDTMSFGSRRLELSPSDIDADFSSLFQGPPALGDAQVASQAADPQAQFALLALLMLLLAFFFGNKDGGNGNGNGAGQEGTEGNVGGAPAPLLPDPGRPKQVLALGTSSQEGPAALQAPPAVGGSPGPVGPFEELIQAAASKYGVPPALIKSVISQESNFDPKARNATSGCTGLMQLDPRYFGNGADLTDPATNIDLGTKELRRLLDKFGGDSSRALVAYNLGEYADPNSIPAGQSITGIEYSRQVLARFA